MEKRWTIKEPGDDCRCRHLAEELNISPILANLLVQRNVFTFDEAKLFLGLNSPTCTILLL
jgi:single-stranded-DNA-specific exonuclease